MTKDWYARNGFFIGVENESTPRNFLVSLICLNNYNFIRYYIKACVNEITSFWIFLPHDNSRCIRLIVLTFLVFYNEFIFMIWIWKFFIINFFFIVVIKIHLYSKHYTKGKLFWLSSPGQSHPKHRKKRGSAFQKIILFCTISWEHMIGEEKSI